MPAWKIACNYLIHHFFGEVAIFGGIFMSLGNLPPIPTATFKRGPHVNTPLEQRKKNGYILSLGTGSLSKKKCDTGIQIFQKEVF